MLLSLFGNCAAKLHLSLLLYCLFLLWLPVKSVIVSNSDSQIHYSGGWVDQDNGGHKYAKGSGSSFTFQFTGTAIEYHSVINPNGGVADIQLDNSGVVSVDESAGADPDADPEPAVLWSQHGLSGLSQHTLTVSYGGAGEQGGAYVEFYFLEYTPSDPSQSSDTGGGSSGGGSSGGHQNPPSSSSSSGSSSSNAPTSVAVNNASPSHTTSGASSSNTSASTGTFTSSQTTSTTQGSLPSSYGSSDQPTTPSAGSSNADQSNASVHTGPSVGAVVGAVVGGVLGLFLLLALFLYGRRRRRLHAVQVVQAQEQGARPFMVDIDPAGASTSYLDMAGASDAKTQYPDSSVTSLLPPRQSLATRALQPLRAFDRLSPISHGDTLPTHADTGSGSPTLRPSRTPSTSGWSMALLRRAHTPGAFSVSTMVDPPPQYPGRTPAKDLMP